MEYQSNFKCVLSRVESVIVSGRFISISLLVCNALLCTLIAVTVLSPASKECEAVAPNPISITSPQDQPSIGVANDEAVVSDSTKQESSANTPSSFEKSQLQSDKSQSMQGQAIGIDLEKYRELSRGL